jgi:hypothetical protein
VNRHRTLARVVAGMLLTTGATAACLGLGPGIASAADGPFTWCPGQSMDKPSGPNSPETPMLSGIEYSWDMNVCHTWYKVDYGYGNVPILFNGKTFLNGSSVWEGDNPPGPNPSGFNCSPFWCPVPPHDDPNFHG